jgi:hypothetical protein
MADDYSADDTTADLLGLSEFSNHSSTEARNQAASAHPSQALQGWKPKLKRKPSRGAKRGQEKLYQGRATSQNQQQQQQQQQDQRNNNKSPSQELRKSSSKYDASPPWGRSKYDASPKSSPPSGGRSSKFDAPWAQQQPQQQQAELKRPKRLSQSNISHGRRRSLSLDSRCTDDVLDEINDGSIPLPFPTDKPKERRRSRSAGQKPKQQQQQQQVLSRRPSLERPSDQRRPSLERRPSVQRRPSLERRPSVQSNRPQLTRRSSIDSSRSLLAGSIQDQDAIPRRKSITTLHVPLKDEPVVRNNTKADRRRSSSWDPTDISDTDRKEGKPRERGRSRQAECVRRRSRSLDAKAFGQMKDDLIPVESMPLNDKPKNRRRSVSWDSGSDRSGKVRSTDIREDLEKRKTGKKAEVESRTRQRHSMPAITGVRNTKNVEDTKQRYSMPTTMKKDRADPNSQEKNRKMEAPPAMKKDRADPNSQEKNRKMEAPPAMKKDRADPNSQEKNRKMEASSAMKRDRTDPNSQEKNRKMEVSSAMKRDRADPYSHEKNRRTETPTSEMETHSEALQAGESSRRRSSRRTKVSARYARLKTSFNDSFSKKFNRRKRNSSSARPTAAAAPVAVASGEASEEIDVERESSRNKKERSGIYISIFMMAVLCFCYVLSLIAFCALGFWLHMEFFAYKDTPGRTGTANAGVNTGTYGNSPGQPGDSSATPMLRPSSLRPSGPTSSINIQPIPTEGGLGAKVSPAATASPTAMASNNPSSNPTPIVSDSPSSIPTSSSYPTSTPSISPSNLASESPSMEPTLIPSESPSLSPTVLDVCPETLSRSMPFISDTSLTFYYETVIYRNHPNGGLLCASLEYSGAAGWIGLAFSTAGRNPQFGRREAVIGMPGVESSVAVSSENVTSQAINPSGNQDNFVEGGPYFVNPGKYEIPAGGLEGYYGPSLNLLMSGYQQTLLNASATTSYDSNQTITRLSFAKYLREPGEIEINPLTGPTLILYAVAPIDANGTYVNENPEWQYINLILEGSSNTRSSFTRKRQHNNAGD